MESALKHRAQFRHHLLAQISPGKSAIYGVRMGPVHIGTGIKKMRGKGMDTIETIGGGMMPSMSVGGAMMPSMSVGGGMYPKSIINKRAQDMAVADAYASEGYLGTGFALGTHSIGPTASRMTRNLMDINVQPIASAHMGMLPEKNRADVMVTSRGGYFHPIDAINKLVGKGKEAVENLKDRVTKEIKKRVDMDQLAGMVKSLGAKQSGTGAKKTTKSKKQKGKGVPVPHSLGAMAADLFW